MITVMVSIFFVLLFAIILVALFRSSPVYYNDFDDEIVTTTTTTTTTTDNGIVNTNIGLNVNGTPVVGMLQRQMDGVQPFVIDPVDGVKWMLNTTDDIYEDASGKWWGLK